MSTRLFFRASRSLYRNLHNSRNMLHKHLNEMLIKLEETKKIMYPLLYHNYFSSAKFFMYVQLTASY